MSKVKQSAKDGAGPLETILFHVNFYNYSILYYSNNSPCSYYLLDNDAGDYCLYKKGNEQGNNILI